jgi:hypothetical protein
MLFFKLLTALLVPFAASGVPTGIELNNPNGLNPNPNNTMVRLFADPSLSNLTLLDQTFNTTVSNIVPPTLSGLGARAMAREVLFRLGQKARQSSRELSASSPRSDNTTVTARNSFECKFTMDEKNVGLSCTSANLISKRILQAIPQSITWKMQ